MRRPRQDPPPDTRGFRPAGEILAELALEDELPPDVRRAILAGLLRDEREAA